MLFIIRSALTYKSITKSLSSARKMSKKASKKSAKVKEVDKADHGAVGPIFLDKNGNVAIRIHAKPGAKHNNITDIAEDVVNVSISGLPVEGEANTVLMKYLASVLGAKKTDVSLDRGCRSRHKVVTVSNSSVNAVIDKLKEEIASNT